MNQQEATDFIRQQLQAGRSHEEIVQLLSQQIPAPAEMLAKFVQKVAAQMPPPQPAPPPEAELPPAFRAERQPEVPPVQPPFQEAAPVVETPAPPEEEIPAAFQAEPHPEVHPEQPPAQEAATVFETPPGAAVAPSPQPEAVESPPLAEPVVSAPSQPETAETLVQAAPAVPASPKVNPLDDPKAVAFVVTRLKQQRRRSDIAMEICERTGVDYKVAQRFVSQVNIEQDKSITSAKNTPVLILCGLFVFSGLVLLALGVIQLLPYVSAFFGQSSSASTAPPNDIQSTIYLLLGGMGLILGGLVGFYLAVRPHMD